MADDEATFAERFTGEPDNLLKPGPEGNTFASFDYAAKYTKEQYAKGNYFRALAGAAGAMIAGTPSAIAGLFTQSQKAYQEGLTPSEEVEFGVNGALTQIGGAEEFKLPKASATAFDNFHDQVVKPIAQQVASPPSEPAPPRIVIPLSPENVSGQFPPPGVARSRLALTGEPHVDAVLNSPVTKDVIDNAVVDRSHDVPYTAGGSTPLEARDTFIDKHFPRSFLVDGVTFDPADPFIIHENVEQHTMGILENGGMDHEAAYRVAHFEFAEKAEGAWYKAHGIDQARAEAAYKPYLDAIQHEPGTDFPPNLFKDPYPHDEPFAARNEALGEPRPTPQEIDRAKQIVDEWQKKPPEEQTQPLALPTVNPLAQAHELGVIGPEREPVPADSPAVAAQRAMPANMRQGDKITMTPAGEPIDTWEQRFNQYIAKVDSRDAFRDMFKRMAAENNNFPQARAGSVSPADVETVAHAAGLDPTALDGVKLRTTFKTDDEIRVVTQTMKKLADDVLDAAEKVRAEATPQNLAELQAAIIKQNYAQDTLQSATRYTNALRAEWGRSGNALQEIQQAAGDLKQINEFLKKYGKGTADDLRNVADGLRGLDRDGVAKNLTSMRGQNPHWTYWLYQQNLISGLVTHVGYGGTNALFTEVERVLAPAFAAMIDKVRGGERNMFLGEAAMAQWGIIHAVPDASRAAWQAFKTNQRVPLKGELEVAERLNGKPPVPYPTLAPNWGRLGDWLGEGVTGKLETALGVPGRFANLEHTFFRALNTDASSKALAYRAAAKEGHPVLSQAFRDSYNRHLANPTDTERQTAIDNGYSGSFMEKLGDSSGAWARWARDNWFFRWIFPFQHIPGNIVRNVARYSPAQILGPEMRAELAGERGAEKQNLAMAKMVIGSSVMGYFAYKALMGEVTGDYPTDPKERQRWQLLNMQPNSVRSGDEWLSLDRYFGPFGILAKVGADLGNIYLHYNGQDDDGVMKAVWAAAHGAANVLGSEVGFISLKNIMDAINDPKAFARYFGYQGGTMIPYSTFLSQDASAIDPYMRQAKGLVDNLKYRIPFLREQVMPKRDPLYGEPVTNPGYFGQAGATAGFIRRTGTPDFVKQELDRIGYFPTAPKPEIRGVKLTPEQFDKYEATAGPLVKAALSGLVQSPSWQAHNSNPEWQKAIAKQVISAARAKARGAVQLDDHSLIEAGRQRRLTQINGPQ